MREPDVTIMPGEALRPKSTGGSGRASGRERAGVGLRSVSKDRNKGEMRRGSVGKILFVAAIVGCLVAFWALRIDRYFTLAYLKGSLGLFKAVYAAHPVALILAYFTLYVFMVSLSVPGAVILTIAAGALFGLVIGTLLVSFASSLGATVACAAARYVLRDWVVARLSGRAGWISEGIEREGAFYLFTLRLIPLFPFWMINLAMGLTKMPLFTYYWVSQVGALPGTIVYVNAGREVGRIDRLSGILSPGLIASFVLVGLFPICAKKLMALYKARREGPDKRGTLHDAL